MHMMCYMHSRAYDCFAYLICENKCLPAEQNFKSYIHIWYILHSATQFRLYSKLKHASLNMNRLTMTQFSVYMLQYDLQYDLEFI